MAYRFNLDSVNKHLGTVGAVAAAVLEPLQCLRRSRTVQAGGMLEPPFRPPSPAGAEPVLSEEMSTEELSGGEPGEVFRR